MRIGFDQTPELNVRETMVACRSVTSKASPEGGFMIVHPRIRQFVAEYGVRLLGITENGGRA